MSLSELQTLYFPGRRQRQLQRELVLLERKAKKYTKAQFRKTRSKLIANYRAQYFLTAAARDLRIAAGRNEDIFIASMMAVTVLSFSAWTTSVSILFLFLETAYDIATLTGTSILVPMLVVAGAIGSLGGWFLAFLLNSLSFSIMDGATRKVQRSVRSTFRKSLHHASRVTTAWAALLAIAAAPFAAAGTSLLIYAQFATVTLDTLLMIAPYAIIAGFSWLLALIMNYSLVPQVALFEPKLPISKTFGRSRMLVQRRGRLFVLSAWASSAATLAITYFIGSGLDAWLGLNKWLIFSFGVFAVVIGMQSILTTLYRKRRLARTN